MVYINILPWMNLVNPIELTTNTVEKLKNKAVNGIPEIKL
jgi:hypothetical protein